MTEREVLKLALEALENTTPTGFNMERDKQFFAAITAIKEVLAQPEQKPVAVYQFRVQGCSDWYDGYPDYSDGKEAYETRTLYTTSPQPEQRQVEETLRYEIDALEAKLAECRAQQPEPVIDKSAAVRIATSLGWAPQREPLTDDDKWKLWVDARSNVLQFARAIEAAHGIKG